MPLLSFGQYAPDISDYETANSQTLLNVLPRGDGYGPFASLAPYTSALPSVCRGYFYARNTDGSIVVFAATDTRLYKLSNTNFGWSDVSLGGSAYPGLPTSDQWQFTQFNNFIIAVQANVTPQVFDLASSSAFANLGGSPPQARYISTVNRFVVLSGLLSNPYRVQWSGLNAVTTWTSGVNSSDYQDLADGGVVRGIAGGETGVIFQDAAIRRMTFSPGSPYVFWIDRISQDDGLLGAYSLVRAGDRIFFCSPQGFKTMVPGGYPTPIGKERVDRTFLADVDLSQPQLFIGAQDPRVTRVFWAYKSIMSGTTGQFDKIIAYDWTLDRWTPIVLSGEYLASLARPGITLESLDSISSSIDALKFSLDDISTPTYAQLTAIDTSHVLGFFTGPNLEATAVTGEQGTDGRRVFFRGFRPITDAATVYGSIGSRSTIQETSAYGAESLINAVGSCPQRVEARYGRAKVRIPAGTLWTYVNGVEIDFQQTGLR